MAVNNQNYTLTIQNISSGEVTELFTQYNSKLETSFLDWNSTYSWDVRSYEWKNFFEEIKK